MNRSEPKISYISQLFILLGLIVVAIIISSFIAVGVWSALTGGSIFNMEKDMLNPAFTNASKWTQIIAATTMFFVPAIAFSSIVNKKPWQGLGFNGVISGKQFFLVIIIAISALFLSGALGTLNEMIPVGAKWAAKFKRLEDSYNEQVKVMAKMNSIGDYIFSLIVIALAPAIVEEVFFRGTLQRFLSNWFKNKWIALVIAAAVFSAVHVSFYGFLSRFALGLVLGLIFIYTKNIWLSILMHFINNGIAVTAMYALTSKGKLADEALKDSMPLMYGVPALAIIIFLMISLKQESETIGASAISEGEPKLAMDNYPFLDDFLKNKDDENEENNLL